MKISDLGLGKHYLSNVQYLSTKSCDTIMYMAPECSGKDVNFTDKRDTFSFGVVMLEVSTQEPPSCMLINISGKPETERRSDDLAKLSNFHPLKPTIVCCLKDTPKDRPDAKEIRDKLMFIVHNPLKVEGVISKGAYGEVSRGTLGTRPVAVKKLHQILLDAAAENDQDMAAMMLAFKRECEILESARNPYIVEFLGVFDEEVEDHGEVLVMELMHQTLEKYLKDHKGNLPLWKQLDIWFKVSCGVSDWMFSRLQFSSSYNMTSH